MSPSGPSAIVLAGGRSSRMGRAKTALQFGDVTLLEVIVGRLRNLFREILVVAASVPLAELSLADQTGVKIIHDEVPFEGPLAALRRGLDAVQGDPVFACSCDLPMLSVLVAGELVSMIDDYDAVIPEVGGIPQLLHAVYRKRCAAFARELLARGERRLGALAEPIKVGKVPESHLRLLDPGLMSFFNINTPDDYLAALQMGGFPH